MFNRATEVLDHLSELQDRRSESSREYILQYLNRVIDTQTGGA